MRGIRDRKLNEETKKREYQIEWFRHELTWEPFTRFVHDQPELVYAFEIAFREKVWDRDEERMFRLLSKGMEAYKMGKTWKNFKDATRWD